jgi:hypothetical protein
MTNSLRTSFVSLLMVLVASCETPQSNVMNTPRPAQPKTSSGQSNVMSEPRPSQPETSSGLGISEAQKKALGLQPGMTEADVRALLGQPDETSSGTYGSATPHPWQGIEWTYRWHQGFFSKRLNIVFEGAPGSWVVNNWRWLEF